MCQVYDKRIDLFSFGVLVYRLLFGRRPFGNQQNLGQDVHELDSSVCNSEPYFPEYAPAICVDFLKRLFHKNPDRRLGSKGYGVILIDFFLDRQKYKSLAFFHFNFGVNTRKIAFHK